MKQIALYGKGGIGKSTTSANISAALSDTGLAVLQIGCDPKRDSTRMLMHGRLIPTVMDQVRERGDKEIATEDIVFFRLRSVRCVGWRARTWCRVVPAGIIATFQILRATQGALGRHHRAISRMWSAGVRHAHAEGYAQEVYLVTSGELMSLYAANNICKAIKRLSGRSRGICRLGGVIGNGKGLDQEEELVTRFAQRIGSSLIFFVPRSTIVQKSELHKKTVIEYAPSSTQASVYRKLAENILANKRMDIPEPLEVEELEELAYEFIKD
jgi:nitrogenase iron protein NifH